MWRSSLPVRRVQLPEKVWGLFEPRRHKVLYGGRCSGKSWSVAIVLLMLAAQDCLRILCMREVQRSIAHSVHQLLCDQMVRLGLQQFYTVTENEIRGQNGSQFLFLGLQSHTAASIKSLESADIVWIEEGQAISKKSLDILLPTIRKPNSEVWVTMNPDTEEDAVFQRFIAKPDDGVWLCRMNWSDNPWFPAIMEDERSYCERFDPIGYANIWEGVPRSAAQGSIYEKEIAALYEDNRVGDVQIDPVLPIHTVWDLGFADESAIIFVQKTPLELRVVDYVEENRRTLEWFARMLDDKKYQYGSHWLPHDGNRASQQTGITAAQMLRQLGHKRVFTLPRASVEDGIMAARSLFGFCLFDRTRCAKLLKALKMYRRSELRDAAVAAPKPIHDGASHGADAWRYLAMCWRMMKNEDYVYAEAKGQDWRG